MFVPKGATVPLYVWQLFQNQHVGLLIAFAQKADLEKVFISFCVKAATDVPGLQWQKALKYGNKNKVNKTKGT